MHLLLHRQTLNHPVCLVTLMDASHAVLLTSAHLARRNSSLHRRTSANKTNRYPIVNHLNTTIQQQIPVSCHALNSKLKTLIPNSAIA